MKRSALIAALAFAGAAHANPNLIVNGSFESGPGGLGSFDGWTTTFGDPYTFVDSDGQTGTHYGQATDGLWSAFFGSLQADGGSTISQSFATTPGQTFTLSFDLANDNGGLAATNDFSVQVGGVTLLDLADTGDQDYATRTFSFVATSASTTLAFAGYNDNSYFDLDRVAVTAVPEPETLPLWIAGLGMIGVVVRGRRER